jgi:hypothetical protein
MAISQRHYRAWNVSRAHLNCPVVALGQQAIVPCTSFFLYSEELADDRA